MADANWYPSWYIVQTRTNYESKVAKNIEQLVKYRKMQDEIFDVKIIADSEVQIKVGNGGEWRPVGADGWRKFLRKINIESVKIDDVWFDNESVWVETIDKRIQNMVDSVAAEASSVFSIEDEKKEKAGSRKFKVIFKECDDNGYIKENKVEFRIVEIKKFPCYVFICAKTILKDIEIIGRDNAKQVMTEPKISDFAWQIVRDAGNAFFVGPDGVPTPLDDDDIKMYGIEKVSVKIDFNIGDMVTILPPSHFDGHMGTVSAIDAENGVVKVDLITMPGVTAEIGVHEIARA